MKLRSRRKEKVNRVIFIGGGSFQGKSLISLHMAYKMKIPLLICTDTIRNTLHFLEPQSVYLSHSTYLLSEDDLKKQMDVVSNVIQGIVQILNKRGEDAIIEGMHFSKDFIHDISGKENYMAVAVDNQLSFYKRIEYKKLTRKRVEVVDIVSGKVTYDRIRRGNILRTRYLMYEKRITDIHREILTSFRDGGFPIIPFVTIREAVEKIECHCLAGNYDTE